MGIDRARLEKRFLKRPTTTNRLRLIEQLQAEGMSLFDAESKVMAMLNAAPPKPRKS